MTTMESSTQGSQGRDGGFSIDNLLVFVSAHTHVITTVHAKGLHKPSHAVQCPLLASANLNIQVYYVDGIGIVLAEFYTCR